MRPNHILKAIMLAMGIAGSANAARIDVLADATLTEFDAALGVRVIKANQTWTSDNQYILTDRLFIKNGQTLTIQPGTKVYASFNANGTSSKTDDKVGSIIAARGGRLVADGTKAAPIVFNAIQVLEMELTLDLNGDSIVGPMPTAATGGLWGGIVLLGNAHVTASDATGLNFGRAEIEGFLPAGTPTNDGDALADAITYGFDANFPQDDADDSGIIRYVSIRHGGYEFSTGREINGLTMGGVGSGTTIEFVEVYANTDDGFEFFGGTVSTRYLVSAFNQDDSFDFDSGHTGTHQFLFAIQNPGLADGGGECDGIEAAKNGSQSAGFIAGLKLSKPILFNMTTIGPGSTNTSSTIALGTGQVLTDKGNVGFVIEDYFNGEFYNSVFHDFSGDLVRFVDGSNNVGANPAAAHNTIGVFGGGTASPLDNASYITGNNERTLFYNSLGAAQSSNSAANTNPLLRVYTRNTVAGSGQGTGTYLANIDPRPQSGSPLLSANGATFQAGAPVPVLFRGAFGDFNWLETWSFFHATYGGTQVQGVDNVAPVIALIGASTVNVVLGSEFTDPGAIVSDYPERTRTITGSAVNTSVAGVQTITYNYTDAGSNAATQVTRTVNVGLGSSDTEVTLTTAVGAPLDISDYFQTSSFEDAEIVLEGSLPKGMKFDAETYAITGYPTVNGTATFTVTFSGDEPVELVMNFTILPVPAAFIGTHVLHTDNGASVTVGISEKGTSVSLLVPPSTKAVSLKGAVLFYDSEEDEWTISNDENDLEIVIPTTRTLKEDDDSFLGDYGSLGGEELWGFKGSTGLGTIVLSKGAVTVTITGVIGSKGVSWTITPTGGKAIKTSGSISVDGIASINTTIPGTTPQALIGMLRVEEELDEDGEPTGALNVALLQGFEDWIPVSFTP